MNRFSLHGVFTLFLACVFLAGCAGRNIPDWSHEAEAAGVPLSPHGKLLTQSAEYWLKKHEEFRSDNENQQPGGIVFLGDSITERFPLEDLFHDLTIINRGIGGDKIGGWKYYGLIDRMDVSVYDLKPRKLFIMIGINDIIYARTPRKFMKRGLKNLFSDLKGNTGDCEIYVYSILPVRDSYTEYNDQITESNRVLEKITKKHGFRFLDIHPYFSDNDGNLKEKFSRDGLHLNPEGYNHWKKIILPWVYK